MAHSDEYMKSIFTAAKEYLPKWVWEHLHKIAFPKSGGHARWRKDIDVEKQAPPMSINGLSVEEIVAQLQIRAEPYSKTEAKYVEPTNEARQACGACRFYIRDAHSERGLCQVVMGGIAWFGTCDFYIGAAEEAAFSLAHIVQKQEGFQLQTILFPKDKFTLRQARAWLKEHEFSDSKVDETENSYRFRQQPPGLFDRLRPICLMPQGAAPNLQACRVLAFGGPVQQEDKEGAAYGGEDTATRRRKREFVHKENGFTEQEAAIEVDEMMRWLDPLSKLDLRNLHDGERQEGLPASALPIVKDAAITKDAFNLAQEVARMDVDRLRRSSLWFIGGDPESKSNYKFTYRDATGRINDGVVRLIVGMFAKGVEVPQELQRAMRKNVSALFEKVQSINKQSAECVADRTADNRNRGMDGGAARREALEYCERLGKAEVTKEIPILKIDEEKQIVYGVVLDPYIVDTQGDWIPPAEVEKTAHDWAKGTRMIGLRHKGEADADFVETFLMPYPSKDDYTKAMCGEPHRVIKFKMGSGFVHSGSWVLGTEVRDATTWQLVKSGELGSYSIGGHGERQDVPSTVMPEVLEFIEADWSKAA